MEDSQPQTFVTMQQLEMDNTVNLPPPLGPFNGPYDFWPPGSTLSNIFGTTAIWQSTPLLFTIMTPLDSDGQPIALHEEQSLSAAFEAADAGNNTQAGSQENEEEDEMVITQSGAGNGQSPKSDPSRDPSALPVPSSHPMPTRAHPRAATIPGMTPGRTRCDTCYENHCRCDHGSDGITDDELAARPHKKEPRARKKGRAKKAKAKKPGGIRKGGSKV